MKSIAEILGLEKKYSVCTTDLKGVCIPGTETENEQDEGHNELFDELSRTFISEEKLVEICSEYFVELGKKIVKGNPKEQVSPARGLSKHIIANLHLTITKDV